MKESGLGAPTRHAIAWREPDFTDRAKTEAEMQRAFDICQGCRRCFNLCDAFPRLFDLIDESPTGEVDGVATADYRKVADACTLCDMCYMTKCPYRRTSTISTFLTLCCVIARSNSKRDGFRGGIAS